MSAETPLDNLSFPVRCDYPECNAVLKNADEVDEHITEEHLLEAVWTFADEHMKPAAAIREEKG